MLGLQYLRISSWNSSFSCHEFDEKIECISSYHYLSLAQRLETLKHLPKATNSIQGHKRTPYICNVNAGKNKKCKMTN